MANYVWNRVICSENTLDKYLIDSYPTGEGRKNDPPYISFNRISGVSSLKEYGENYGVYISYGTGFSQTKRTDELVEVKFCTRWEYPIRAILKLLELTHDTVWYAVEENHSYVSKFIWQGEICEYVAPLGDEYFAWEMANDEFISSIEDSNDADDGAWYYLERKNLNWQIWKSCDNFKRYLDVSVCTMKGPDF